MKMLNKQKLGYICSWVLFQPTLKMSVKINVYLILG